MPPGVKPRLAGHKSAILTTERRLLSALKNCPHIEFDNHAKFGTVSHTVCAHVGGLKNLGTLGPHPLGTVDAPETLLLPYVTISNFTVLDQTVRA